MFDIYIGIYELNLGMQFKIIINQQNYLYYFRIQNIQICPINAIINQISLQKIKMGKTKKIAKEPKEAKQQVQQEEKKTKKGGKKQIDQEQNLQVFTPKFYETLSSFQSFYKQVLELKAKTSDSNVNQQLKVVKQRVSADLEEASSNILKRQLNDLENWIQSEQERLAKETENIRQCYNENRKSLESTGAFTADQVTKQLSPIQAKINQKQANHDNYGQLLARSKNIYE